MTCLWATLQEHIPQSSFVILFVCCLFVPFALPVFPVLISCWLSMHSLHIRYWRGSQRRVSTVESIERKRYASESILLITLVYVVLNIPVCIYYILELVTILAPYHIHIFPHTWHQVYPRVFLAVFCVAINSAVNPIIYFCRIKNFRSFIREACLCRKICNVRNISPGVPLKTLMSQDSMPDLNLHKTNKSTETL